MKKNEAMLKRRSIITAFVLLALVGGIGIASAGDWEHDHAPYDSYANWTVNITGPGVTEDTTYTVTQIEDMTNVTRWYTIRRTSSSAYEAQLKGVRMQDLLYNETGLNANASKITVYADDGWSRDFTMDEVNKSNYQNEIGWTNLSMILAWGKNGYPLVHNSSSPGYIGDAWNDGGPLRLIVGQSYSNESNAGKCVKHVTDIYVEGNKPTITSYIPSTPYVDVQGVTRTFKVTVNQVVNVSWYNDGNLVQTNSSVTEASYTNTSVPAGTRNVSAIASNTNGTDMQTWDWHVLASEPGWEHDYSPYNDTRYTDWTVNITGPCCWENKTYNVTQIEAMTDGILTEEYYLKGRYQAWLKGVWLWHLLNATGNNMDGVKNVTVYSDDGWSQTFTMDEVARTDYVNDWNASAKLKMILAYGKNYYPMVVSEYDVGYVDYAFNKDGPLRLFVGQSSPGAANAGNCMKRVTDISVKPGGLCGDVNCDSWVNMGDYNALKVYVGGGPELDCCECSCPP